MTKNQTNLQILDDILKKDCLVNDLFDMLTRTTDPDETRILLREYSLNIINHVESLIECKI